MLPAATPKLPRPTNWCPSGVSTTATRRSKTGRYALPLTGSMSPVPCWSGGILISHSFLDDPRVPRKLKDQPVEPLVLCGTNVTEEDLGRARVRVPTSRNATADGVTSALVSGASATLSPGLPVVATTLASGSWACASVSSIACVVDWMVTVSEPLSPSLAQPASRREVAAMPATVARAERVGRRMAGNGGITASVCLL